MQATKLFANVVSLMFLIISITNASKASDTYEDPSDLFGGSAFTSVASDSAAESSFMADYVAPVGFALLVATVVAGISGISDLVSIYKDGPVNFTAKDLVFKVEDIVGTDRGNE